MDQARLSAAADRLENFIFQADEIAKIDATLRQFIREAQLPDLKFILAELRSVEDPDFEEEQRRLENE